MDDVILHGYLTPREDEKLCESHVFWFLQCFQQHQAYEGQTGSERTGSLPHNVAAGLPHQRATDCEDRWQCVQHWGLQYRGPAGDCSCLLSFQSLYCRLLTPHSKLPSTEQGSQPQYLITLRKCQTPMIQINIYFQGTKPQTSLHNISTKKVLKRR